MNSQFHTDFKTKAVFFQLTQGTQVIASGLKQNKWKIKKLSSAKHFEFEFEEAWVAAGI